MQLVGWITADRITGDPTDPNVERDNAHVAWDHWQGAEVRGNYVRCCRCEWEGSQSELRPT
jgi:hypothetical protein